LNDTFGALLLNCQIWQHVIVHFGDEDLRENIVFIQLSVFIIHCKPLGAGIMGAITCRTSKVSMVTPTHRGISLYIMQDSQIDQPLANETFLFEVVVNHALTTQHS